MKSLRKDKGSGNNTDKFRRKLKRKRIYYSLLAVLFGIMLIPIAATGLGFQKYFYSVLYQNAVTENASKLEGAKGIMEENFHLLDQIALKIAISADMTPYAIGKDPLNAISQLTSFSGLSTFLDNIIVYYGEGEYFLTSHGMLSDSSFLEGYLKSDELYDTIVNAQEVMVYNANKFGRRQRWDHILYIVPLSIWAQREDGVCIFLLRTDALQKMVQASFSAPSDKMLIYDGHGELILSSGSKDYEYFSNEGNLFFDAANLEEIVYGDTEYVCSKTTSSRGYLFGGLAAYRSIRLGFVCQIGLYLTAGLYALLAMPETRQPEKKTGGRWPVREANPFLSLVRLRHIEPWQTAVFWSILIAACGGWMFESAFNYSISAFFSFSPLFNGVLKCGVGILNSLVGAGVIRRLVRRGTIRGPLLLVGVLCMAASLLSACSTDRAILFFPFSVCFLLINSLNLPLHQALLTTNKANLPVGELMGLFNAFRSIGQVAGSMVSGFSYTVGHALPFFCASAFFMMMVFILRWGTSGERKRHANGGIKRRKKNG